VARIGAAAVHAAICAAALLVPGSSRAELDDTTLVGAAVRLRPAYDGSASQVRDLVPVLRVFGEPWFVRTTQDVFEGGIRHPFSPDLQVGAQLAYEPGRETSEAQLLASHHVPDVGQGSSVGAFVEWDRKFGPMPISLLARGRQDTRLSHGSQADVRLNAGIYGKGRVEAGAFAQASWASRKSAQALYGIAPAESTATGLPAFQANAGWAVASAGLVASVNVSKRWVIVGSVERHWLVGDITRSPLAQCGGRYATLGLAFHP
jgi:outer membrane scaffolding protein for murein synthesis (MipA/OmpV family)